MPQSIKQVSWLPKSKNDINIKKIYKYKCVVYINVVYCKPKHLEGFVHTCTQQHRGKAIPAQQGTLGWHIFLSIALL